MRDAYERMPETFLDWMLECPVPWICIKINKTLFTIHLMHHTNMKKRRRRHRPPLSWCESPRCPLGPPGKTKKSACLAALSPQVIYKKNKVRK